MRKVEPVISNMNQQEKIAIGLIAFFGVLIYGFLAGGIFRPDGYLAYGDFVYNYYFLSLLDGRLDIPVRAINFEGVYDPETGRAYGYYGLAPLLTRLIAAPFVELRDVSLSAVTIFFFAAAGSAVYHFGVVRIVMTTLPIGSTRLSLLCLASLAVWFASPGLLLASNGSFYQEPIAASYFGSAGVLVCVALAVFCKIQPARLVVASAVFMIFCIHGRPQVALGISPAFIALLYFSYRESGFQQAKRMVTAIGIFGTAGVLFVVSQTLTVGSPLHQIGVGPKPTNPMEYGFSFWEIEPAGSPRWAALAGTGRFNSGRILPGLILYGVDRPEIKLRQKIQDVYRGMSETVRGVRIERPRYGFVYLWMPWLLITLFALPMISKVPARSLWIVIPATLSAIATLAYATITHRYQVDVWPIVIAPGLVALAMFGGKKIVGDKTQANAILAIVALGVLYAGHMNYRMTKEYSGEFPQNWLFKTWPEEVCLDFSTHKGFTMEHAKTICTLP